MRDCGDLMKLKADAEIAQERFRQAFMARFPVGGLVFWTGTHNEQEGVVKQYGFGDRLKVQNKVTRAAYWIHFHRVLGAV